MTMQLFVYALSFGAVAFRKPASTMDRPGLSDPRSPWCGLRKPGAAVVDGLPRFVAAAAKSIRAYRGQPAGLPTTRRYPARVPKQE